jgi:hypothetical protein
VLRKKYAAPNSASGSTIRLIGAGGVTSQKKSDAAAHIETAGAAMLKSRRVGVRMCRGRRIDITSPSAPDSSAPAAGPNRSAAAMVKVSDTDTLIGVPGMRAVAHPVISVSSASTIHVGGTGPIASWSADHAITIVPDVMTMARYAGRSQSELNLRSA